MYANCSVAPDRNVQHFSWPDQEHSPALAHGASHSCERAMIAPGRARSVKVRRNTIAA